jgi:hypothetical protein
MLNGCCCCCCVGVQGITFGVGFSTATVHSGKLAPPHLAATFQVRTTASSYARVYDSDLQSSQSQGSTPTGISSKYTMHWLACSWHILPCAETSNTLPLLPRADGACRVCGRQRTLVLVLALVACWEVC